ncbi:MAG: VOC family protein [Verrucomicrobiales bacterium]
MSSPSFRVHGLDHVQLAMPRGGEVVARSFYSAVLGLIEVEKPAPLRQRGGVWFKAGHLQVHLGIEEPFRPARKAHPAFLVDGLPRAIVACENAGLPVVVDAPFEVCQRVYVADPFGNRIELIERRQQSA